MGDYILMKKLFILPLVPLWLLGAVNEDLAWVDKQVEAIKPPRSGVSARTVNKTRSPFFKVSEKQTVVKNDGTTVKTEKKPVWEPLKLEALLNRSALITGNWYKEGERVRQYKVAKISHDSVLLKSRHKQLKLSIKAANPKIKLQTK